MTLVNHLRPPIQDHSDCCVVLTEHFFQRIISLRVQVLGLSNKVLHCMWLHQGEERPRRAAVNPKQAARAWLCGHSSWGGAARGHTEAGEGPGPKWMDCVLSSWLGSVLCSGPEAGQWVSLR